MAVWNKFNAFADELTQGNHDLSSATIKVFLTAVAPVATNSVKTDITELSTGNGYTAGGIDMAAVRTVVSGQVRINGTDITVTASGGSIGPFRYAVFFNESHSSDGLMGWYDYGSSLTVADGSSFQIDFPTDVFTFQ